MVVSAHHDQVTGLDAGAAQRLGDMPAITRQGKATVFSYLNHRGSNCVAKLVLDLVGVVCDAIPIVGAICMLVGFIFSIAAMIVKENSDPPMILFIKKEIVPFLKKLPVPPVSAARYKLAPFAAV